MARVGSRVGSSSSAHDDACTDCTRLPLHAEWGVLTCTHFALRDCTPARPCAVWVKCVNGTALPPAPCSKTHRCLSAQSPGLSKAWKAKPRGLRRTGHSNPADCSCLRIGIVVDSPFSSLACFFVLSIHLASCWFLPGQPAFFLLLVDCLVKESCPSGFLLDTCRWCIPRA